MRAREVKKPHQAACGERFASLDISGAKLAGYNLVVVFEELPIGAILHEMARRLLPEHPSPLITEIPDQLLTVIYPQRQIQCQFANRRVDVRDRRGMDPATEPFSTVAINAVEAATTASGKPVVAYGYNFDVHLPLQGDDPAVFLKARFLTDPNKLGQAFGGDVKTVGIKASIHRSDSQANFDIEPLLDGQTGLIKAHVNYHYERRKPPAQATELVTQIQERYQEFLTALQRL
ncbi:MAG: hypothetical protein ACE5IZ_07960 [Dehalococcoidia bacterium]